MSRQNKDSKDRPKRFRISLIDDDSHKELWMSRFTRNSLFVSVLSILFVVIGLSFCAFAFTPLKTLIPGYPDARSKRMAVQNAFKIDSLENVMTKWSYYSENLRRVLQGADPMSIDSLMANYNADTARVRETEALKAQDSLLRKSVRDAEEFGLRAGASRDLPIEGIHFFTPLKGTVSQKYDKYIHPYIDLTAPAGAVVMSVLDGTVINAGWNEKTGYTIAVQHSGDIVSIYMHNDKLFKKTGDKVTAGTPIALVGNTGSLSTGAHLHFELWYKGEAVDPTQYINF